MNEFARFQLEPVPPRTLSQKLFRTLMRTRMNSFAGIPGPTPSLPLGNALDFLSSPWAASAKYAERYGGMLVAWLPLPTIVLTDPKLIWQVLEGDFDNYYKDSPRRQFLPVLTDATEFLANGGAWREKRERDPIHNVLSPGGFTFSVQAVRETVEQWVRDYVEKTGGESLENVVPDIMRIAFDMLSLQVVGRRLEKDVFDALSRLLKVGNDRITPPPVNLPFFLVGERTRTWWQKRFEQLVQEARLAPATFGESILHTTLRVGTALDDSVLATQLGNVYFGGITSITGGVINTLFLLTQRPDIRARVSAELLGLKKVALDSKLEALELCPEFNRVILESLRVLPPVPLFMRSTHPTRPVTLGGHVLPPNTSILITCWPLHRSAQHWTAPERFEPERWTERTLRDNSLGSDYFFPFGRGRRTCGGYALGLLNIKLLVMALLSTCLPEVGSRQAYEGELFFGAMRPRRLRARFLASNSLSR